MKYKSFRKIEEKLPVLGLGTWQFSGKDSWYKFDKNEAIRIVEEAVDNGITFIDTAPVYGLGHSEEVVGEAIKGRRDKVFLASKLGLPWDESNNVRNDLSRNSIMKEIDDSLKRLGTDHIDLYQIHWPDPNTDIRETMQALSEVKRSGKIRYIGVSNFSLDLLKKAMEVEDVVSHQGLYNMFEENAESYHGISLGYKVKDELLPYLEKEGMFFLPYSPLMQGLLAGSDIFDKDVRKNNPVLNGSATAEMLEKVKKIEKETGERINITALKWLFDQSAVGPVIAGVTSPHQLRDNLLAVK